MVPSRDHLREMLVGSGTCLEFPVTFISWFYELEQAR